jgi:eukaryotic-like serine/threonine-protein kinase
VAKAMIRDRPNDAPIGAAGTNALASIARTRGQLRESARRRAGQAAADLQRGLPQASLNRGIADAMDRVWFLGDAAGAAAMVDKAVAETPLDRLPIAVRPYSALATAYALAGQPDKARRIAAGFEKSRLDIRLRDDTTTRHSIQGAIAMTEKRYDDAAREYSIADAGLCTICVLPQLASAYDRAGKTDSAIAVFERYLKTPDFAHVAIDGQYAAATHKRLGEMYEAKGDRTNALDHYDKFVELWKNADPELQPQVADVRRRIARLRLKG